MTIFEEYKEEVINSFLKGNGYLFEYKFGAIKRDIDVVKILAGMAKSDSSFKSDIDVNFKRNETIILAFMEKFNIGNIYNLLDSDIKGSKSLVLKMLKLFKTIHRSNLPDDLILDEDIQKAALECNDNYFPFSGIYKEKFESLNANKSEEEHFYKATYSDVKNDEAKLLKALKENAEIITKIPKENRYKKEYLLALGYNYNIKDKFFQEMPEELLNDKEVIKHLIKAGYENFIKNIYDYRSDKQLAITCFQESFTYLPHFINIMDDKEVREAYLNSFKKYE